jgi:hypothetical protein
MFVLLSVPTSDFFLELRHGELPRIYLLGGWVNKGIGRAKTRSPSPLRVASKAIRTPRILTSAALALLLETFT